MARTNQLSLTKNLNNKNIMEIQGLLQFIKPLLKDKHISEYHGEKLGVDSYCWY